MGPDRSNYQIWLIDYLDGNLDMERKALLLSFLDENPDIKEEMTDLIAISIKPDPGTVSKKENLKKVPSELSEHQFEMLCIASSENDLNNYQRAELEEIMAGNPERRRTFELCQKIKLIAPAEKFRYKYRFRRLTGSQKVFRYAITTITAAAAVVIMILIFRNPVVTPHGPETAAIKRDTPFKSTLTPSVGQSPEKNEKEVRQTDIHTIAINSVPVRKNASPVSDNPGALTVQSKDSIIPEIERTEISKVSFTESGFTAFQPDTRLAVISITPVNEPPDPEDNGPGQLISRFFREKIIKQKTSSEKGSRNVYEIAGEGINKLNKLFGWDMSLQESKNEKGEVSAVHFNSRLVKFDAPVKKGSLQP